MVRITKSPRGFWSAVDWKRIELSGMWTIRGPGRASRGWLIGSTASGSLPGLLAPFVHYKNPGRRWLALGRAMARERGMRLVEVNGYFAFEQELVALDGGKAGARGTARQPTGQN